MGATISILVDEDVFEFLQRHATPLVDSPNDVLRRLLLGPDSVERKEDSVVTSPAPEGAISADAFAETIRRQRFGPGFRRVRPYRMMFESSDTLAYFQNFNKPSDHLWYRVTEKPWSELVSSPKRSWLVLTNPAERFAYVLPVSDVTEHAAHSKWTRPYLEINIDPSTSRWTELDWRIEEYLERF